MEEEGPSHWRSDISFSPSSGSPECPPSTKATPKSNFLTLYWDPSRGQPLQVAPASVGWWDGREFGDKQSAVSFPYLSSFTESDKITWQSALGAVTESLQNL